PRQLPLRELRSLLRYRTLDQLLICSDAHSSSSRNYHPAMLRTLWAVFVAAVVTVPLSTLTILVAIFSSNARLIVGITRLWAWTIVRSAGIELHATGTEVLDPQQRYILIANHHSYFD